MKLSINSGVYTRLQNIKVAGLVFKNLQNQKKISVIEQLLRGACAQKKKELKDEEKAKTLAEYFENAKIDKQTLPEIQLLESNIRKIERRKNIESKNNLHALLHFFALKWNIPVYAKDLDQVETDISLDFIQLQKGKRAQDIELSPKTQNIVIWITNIGNIADENFQSMSKELSSLISKYCGGEVSSNFILDNEKPEIDLDYMSSKEEKYIQATREKELEEAQQHQADTAEAHAETNGETPDANPSQQTSEPETSPEIQSPDEPESPPTTGPSEPKTLLMEDILAEFLLEAVEKWRAAENVETAINHKELNKELNIEVPNNAQHGDYSSSIALKLAKQTQKNPQEVAKKIITYIQVSPDIEKIDIAGPGFINFHLTRKFFIQQLENILTNQQNFGYQPENQNSTVVVEYSQPNIAKPLGVHHLLSTLIGQVLADMHRAAGYKTISLNYLGDWGTQFGKLLYAYKHWGDKETVSRDPLNELQKLYVRFHEEEEKDEKFVENGRTEFKKLEEGDEENSKLLDWIRDISIQEVERLYKILGVSFDEVWGEKMFLEGAKQMVTLGKEKGVFTMGEKGALIAEFENLPAAVIEKGDGTSIYLSRDIANFKHRIERFHPQKLIYVVDVAQKLHFQQLFAICEKMDLIPEPKPDIVHVIFGRMQLPEGKMSTRKGTVIYMDVLIKEAIERTAKLVAEKGQGLSPKEQEEIAHGMAVGAIKYNIISQNRETNMVFDWDRMLSLEGNSAPYLQYAYARAQSILRKSHEEKHEPVAQTQEDGRQVDLFTMVDAKENDKTPHPNLQNPENETPYSHKTELDLIKLLYRCPENFTSAVRELKPNFFTTYLYEVAKSFNSFYSDVHVLGAHKAEVREARMNIVKATAQTLKDGLAILGIPVFERL